jgi:pyruvate-formate lyase-activating enzyme
MLFADPNGRIYEHPRLEMVGSIGPGIRRVFPEEVIPLPPFSKLFYIPGCPPVGFDSKREEFVILRTMKLGRREFPCFAVSSFLEPGYVRTLLPAADFGSKDYVLPLWAYTSVGFGEDSYVTAAFQIECNPHWDPSHFDDRDLVPKIKQIMKKKKGNPLYHHLKDCAVHNHCFAAKNLFLERWEAPLPVSRSCNARCLGCLSEQTEDACRPAHDRISFRPTVRQVVDLASAHLEKAHDPIVSFGQGCEGEPLMEYRLVRDSIRKIRMRAEAGTINMNTNGSIPERVASIAEAGLDSIRISISSARPSLYNAYFRPRGYAFEDVCRTLSYCVENGLYTMINYLVFPGISDQEEEVSALFELIQRTGVHFIHLKNLNIDPDLYLRSMPSGDSSSIGIKRLHEAIKSNFPEVEVGYFNRAVKKGENACPKETA